MSGEPLVEQLTDLVEQEYQSGGCLDDISAAVAELAEWVREMRRGSISVGRLKKQLKKINAILKGESVDERFDNVTRLEMEIVQHTLHHIANGESDIEVVFEEFAHHKRKHWAEVKKKR
jgi:hypothetical protein